eukprot:TRINITY_DN96253_c0_g1_i1.p1 TRINITY_DN96253_c0_g1~~TRINITY_DN96253_c0_g1_i1.p1  ORF type:complete len:207 (+),score=33.40 TRINITY_DN96253_c0_g1_i1:174-794(+)
MLHLCKKTIIDEYPSIKQIGAGGKSEEVFTIKPSSTHEQQSILSDAAGNPVFAVTRKCEKLSDVPSIFAVDKAGKVQEELFRVSKTNKHKSPNRDGLTATLQTVDGKTIEINGTLDVFGCVAGRNGSRGGHIRLGDMGKGTPIAKLINPNERRDLDLQRPSGKKPEDYLVEVVPGVDITLILAVVFVWEVLESCDIRCENYLAAGG